MSARLLLIAVSVSGLLVGVTPAVTAVDQLPPTTQLSAEEISRLGQRYLDLVCPSNRSLARVDRAVNKAWPKRTRIPKGWPVPKYARKAYRTAAAAFAREATQMNRTAWPSDIAGDIEKVIRHAISLATYYESRNTPVVIPRDWQDKVVSQGDAPANIRLALKLPVPVSGSDGC